MIINISCLVKACDELGIKYSFLDENSNLVRLDLNRPYYFSNSSTPLNSQDVASICLDKDFSYKVLNGLINIPKTKSYLDVNVPESYLSYLKFKNTEEIVKDILNNFSLPVIVKRNSGAQGNNVFLCKTVDEVTNSINEIFKHDSKSYDYIALAQEYIKIKKEFRVIVFDKKVLFAYEKNTDDAKYINNLSPLHWENSKAILVKDQNLLQNIEKFISPIYKNLNLIFGGLDIVMDENDNLYLLELNTKPGFAYFVKNNGEEELIKMYKNLLEYLKNL